MLKYKLDLQFFSGEKTEKATPKKRQDVRKKGQTAKSQDINTAIILLAVFFLFMFYGSNYLESFYDIFYLVFEKYFFQELNEVMVETILLDMFQLLFTIIGPVFLIAFIAALVANIMQIGFLTTVEPLKMKLEKLIR